MLGRRLTVGGSKVGRVLERKTSARVDSILEDPEVDQDEARRMGVRTGMYVPLMVAGRAIGVVAVHDKLERDGRFSESDLRVAEIFAARAAVAVDLSRRVARDTLRRVIDAQELERQRLARELHDETGQALTSILLGLKAIRAAPNAGEAEQAEATVRELVVQALHPLAMAGVIRCKAGKSSSLIRRMLASAWPTGMPLQWVRKIRKLAPASSQHGRSCS